MFHLQRNRFVRVRIVAASAHALRAWQCIGKQHMQNTNEARTLSTGFAIDIALITALWWITSIVINSTGDFPLADDWSYGWTVRHLLATGDYRPLEFTPAPMISNVLWGSLFCLPAGFSFTALRISSLTASLLASIGCYVLVRDLKRPRHVGVLVALSLAFNPIYYAVSYTFDTDALFCALMIWSAVFFARYLVNGSDVHVVLGAMFAVGATLSRELALCVPLAFAVITLPRHGVRRLNILRALIPLLLCIGAFLSFRRWLAATGRVPAFVDAKTNELLHALTNFSYLTKIVFDNAFVILTYLGLFLLPVLLMSFGDLVRSNQRHAYSKRATILISIGIITMLAGALVRERYGVVPDGSVPDAELPMRNIVPLIGNPILMPTSGMFMNSLGLGPFSTNPLAALPAGFWMIVTVMGCVGAGLLVLEISIYSFGLFSRFTSDTSDGDIDVAVNFLLLTGIVYLLPLLIASVVLDRYPVPLAAVLAAAVTGMAGNRSPQSSRVVNLVRVTAFAVLTAFGLFAVGGTHDYVARNRARWEAFRKLTTSDHIDPKMIDGGEFSYAYPFDILHPLDIKQLSASSEAVPSTYLISFTAQPGYTKIRKYKYQNWIPPSIQNVFVLRKD